MSIIASDLIIYGAQNIAEDDVSTQGGAINTAVRYVFDDATLANTLNDTVEIVSSAAGDTTQTVTITGRNAGGSIVTDALSLNGTTQVNGVVIFERILKIVVSAVTVGTVTVQQATGDVLIVDIEPGVTEVRRPFYDVSSDVLGGSARVFYEKIFLKNNNVSNSLLNAVIKENADTLGKITFDLEDAQDDNNSTASRLDIAPTGMLGSFDGTDKNVPGTDLASTSAIGIWLKLDLADGDAADKGTYTIEADGSTT